jgi:DNA-binding NarL/FixJ family response regulator
MRPTRRLTPTEEVIGSLVCEGLSNVAIADRISSTEKAVENAIFRLARCFEIKSDGDTNCRVLLALAYRSHFGDRALDKLGVHCCHQAIAPDGTPCYGSEI